MLYSPNITSDLPILSILEITAHPSVSLLSVTVSFLLPLPAIPNDQWHLHKARHRSKLLQTLSAGNIQSQSLDHLWNKLRGSAFSISLWTTLCTSMPLHSRGGTAGGTKGYFHWPACGCAGLCWCYCEQFAKLWVPPWIHWSYQCCCFLKPNQKWQFRHGRAVIEWMMLVWGGACSAQGKWGGPVKDRQMLNRSIGSPELTSYYLRLTPPDIHHICSTISEISIICYK